MRNFSLENMSRRNRLYFSPFGCDLLHPDKAALISIRPPIIILMGKQKEYKTINTIYLFPKSKQRVKIHDLGVIFF